MKNITIMIFFTIVLFLNQNWAQYNIPEIQGIPLISYDTDWSGWTEEDYKTMKDSAGVDILIATNLSSAKLQRLITGPGLYAIPNQTESQQNPEVKNWIYYYSEGRYTNWEAEGTNPEDGDASIYYKNNIGSVFQEGSIKGVATNDYALADTLIYGPLYRQEVRYFVTDTNIINYKTDYKLKLVNLPHRQGDPLPQPTDEICRLQVTVSDIYIDTIPDPDVWVKVTAPVLGGDVLLRRSNFSIGNWETKTIEYRLNELADNFYERINNSNGENKFARYVEFKIIWLGDSNSKLYVDNIVVSDERGTQIRNPIYQARIIEQDNATYIASNYAEFIKAWIGRDEPESIDMFEPIRIISSLLNDNNGGERPLIMNLSSTWNGRFGDQIPWKNSNYVAKSVEFVKRTKNIHIWQNTYMFDYPFKYNGELWWVDDYRDWNIKIFADSMLSRINKVDPQFGQLILCGKFDHNVPNVSFRDITPNEFAYASHLSLLYGAKSLVLFGYFGNDNPPYPNYTGLVNWDFGAKNKTDRFYYVKNTLSPRLKGLFGQTLKKLVPKNQVLKTPLNTQFLNSNFIDKIIKGNCTTQGSQSDDYIYDLGFFTDSLNCDYFMILSRWYKVNAILLSQLN